MADTRRQKVIDSVMRELRGYLDAVEAYQTAVATQFGLDRTQLRCFAELVQSDGMARDELRERGGLSDDALGELIASGHLEELPDGRVAVTAPARERYEAAMAPIEAAEAGLHRYGAEELGIVRNFLRVGRQFYERQLSRMEGA